MFYIFNRSFILYVTLLIIIFLSLYFHKTNKYTKLKDGIVVRTSLSPEVEFISREKIEMLSVYQNIIYKMFGIYRLELGIRGADGLREIDSIVFNEGEFDDLILYYKKGEK